LGLGFALARQLEQGSIEADVVVEDHVHLVE